MSKRKASTALLQGCFILLFISYIPSLFAQGSSGLTLYDEDGVAFRVKLKGKWNGGKGGSPRLTLDSLEAGTYELQIRYPDTTIPDLEKRLELKPYVSLTYSLQPIDGDEERDWNLISRIRTEGPKKKDAGDTMDAGPMTREEPIIPEADSAFIHSYKGESACSDPVGDGNFERVHGKVEAAIFQKERVRIAKEWIMEHCVLSSHVAALMKTLDYEEDRLDIAKYAYGKTFDQKNYDRVRKALNFKRSRRELDGYLRKLR